MVNPRVPRESSELIAALGRHVTLLREFCVHAFQEGDERYLGEVAGKLRLLVHEGGSNTPLLLSLADHFGADTSLILGGPPVLGGGNGVLLRDHLASLAFFSTTETGEQISLSNSDVIPA